MKKMLLIKELLPLVPSNSGHTGSVFDQMKTNTLIVRCRRNSYVCNRGKRASIDIAREYLLHGWMPLPVAFMSKNPGIPGWQHFAVTAATLHEHFNGRPLNIGVLLGQPSNDLEDVDLDAEEAVKIASFFLHKTDSVVGRAGKPNSHWLYYCSQAKTKRFLFPLKAD